MCRIQKLIYCVCAHTEASVGECEAFFDKPDKSERWRCIKPVCQHTRQLFLHHGLCPSCRSHFNCGIAPTEAFVRSFWAHKNRHKIDTSVEAWTIPGEAIFESDPETTGFKAKSSYCTAEEVAIMIAISRDTEHNPDCEACRTAKPVYLRGYAAAAKRFVLQRAQEEDRRREGKEQCTSAQDEDGNENEESEEQKAVPFNLDSTVHRMFSTEADVPSFQGRLEKVSHPELLPKPLIIPCHPKISAILALFPPALRVDVVSRGRR